MARNSERRIRVGDVIDGLKIISSAKAPETASVNEKRFNFWNTKCETCGEERVLSTRFLHSKRSGLACHKCRKDNALCRSDLKGQEFGSLTVTDSSVDGNPKRVKASCKCGGEIEVSRSSLLAGKVTNCLKCETGRRRRKDKVGQKFGNLTVLEEAARPENFKTGRDRWYRCKCECGEVIETRSYTLRSDESSQAVNNCGFHGTGMRYVLNKDELKFIDRGI